ncbi:MAG TPA: class I SAM-dependent methyltransferase [Firmicutes bacterium]|jgi:ubiquinone/menaquinone biosynthesis C-methylase UbiE|nr:class I SAM-dependent methyltransferase [Bacillota bacterium]
MAEGNDFVNELIWPAVKELLLPHKGDRILDIACGNGLTSRRLAETCADVVAFDFSEEMIAIAQQRTKDCPVKEHIVYKIIDATDSEALLRLGAGSFTGALCNMALMDMADIRPLMNSLAILLQPGGRFVFSVLHPCFNNPSTVLKSELEDRDGKLVIQPTLLRHPAILPLLNGRV